MINQAMIKGAKHNMKKSQSKKKFVRIISTPYRVLLMARDFYMHSMTNCTGRVSYGGAHQEALPRSFSATLSSSNVSYDFGELLRAASARMLGNDGRVELEILLQQHAAAAKSRTMMRSFSFGMRRIDEEKVCEDEYGEEINSGNVVVRGKVKKSDLMYPRSKSYAVCLSFFFGPR